MISYAPVTLLKELKEFECQINFFGQGRKSDKDFSVYCMDDGLRKKNKNNPDMRINAVGAGTCSCCDYLQIRDNAILLIEETDICRQKEDIIEKECAGMSEEQIDEYVKTTMNREFSKKLYGALLMLHWLKGYNNLDLELEKKAIDFLVIYNDDDEQGHDSFKTDLKSCLKGELRNKIRDVRVVSVQGARAWLQRE